MTVRSVDREVMAQQIRREQARAKGEAKSRLMIVGKWKAGTHPARAGWIPAPEDGFVYGWPWSALPPEFPNDEPSEVINVQCPALIQIAWGRRRVSSRASGGTKAYPSSLTASRRLWRDWINRALAFDFESIVIDQHRATARIEKMIEGIGADDDQPEAMPQSEIDRLTAERVRLRAERRFAEADEIRDALIAAGVTVADGAIA